MIVPFDALSAEALNGLLEEFVTRDGTDYGDQEISLSAKVAQVRRMLSSGEAVILFSESTGLCNIVLSSSLDR